MNQNKEIYDCVIVGGGSAGLSAAFLLGRGRRQVLVCDKGNPRNASAHKSHSFFTRDGISSHELRYARRKPVSVVKPFFQLVTRFTLRPVADAVLTFHTVVLLLQIKPTTSAHLPLQQCS